MKISLEPVAQDVRGLAGLTMETADGASIALDRGEAACAPCGMTRRGPEHAWTVLGASRGEAGILGEGIRQALLRDPTYRPALQAAEVMIEAAVMALRNAPP